MLLDILKFRGLILNEKMEHNNDPRGGGFN